MKENSITRGRGKPRKIIGQTIKKDLYLNHLLLDFICDRTGVNLT